MVEAIPKSTRSLTHPDARRVDAAVAAPSDISADYRGHVPPWLTLRRPGLPTMKLELALAVRDSQDGLPVTEITWQGLADSVGSAREVVPPCLHSLSDAGLFTNASVSVTVVDAEALQHLTDTGSVTAKGLFQPGSNDRRLHLRIDHKAGARPNCPFANRLKVSAAPNCDSTEAD